MQDLTQVNISIHHDERHGYSDNVPTINEVRSRSTERQRSLLEEIWWHYINKNEWPVAFEFHSPNRKAEIRETLKPLSGSVVIEVSDSQFRSRYQLTLLGVLLTTPGQELQHKLVRYLEYVRMRYQTRPTERTIKSSDVQAELGLNDDEIKLLGRLVVLGNLYDGGAGYSTNWSSKDWQAGILQSAEDFPDGDLNGELEKLVLRGYDSEVPVFLDDRHRMASLNAGQITVTHEQVIRAAADPRNVFVVHGRNESARRAMFSFLRAIGLQPLEWSQVVKATGKPNPYLGEVLEKGFAIARAVVVLWTPDDEARLHKEFIKPDDPHYELELTGQARPNVLFETGMAMGLHPERTILVELGMLRPFSDVLGRHVIKLSDSVNRRQDLANRLKQAGCVVNVDGTDWHTEGCFDLAQNPNKIQSTKSKRKLPRRRSPKRRK